jgi:hypothetical protein
MFAPVEEDQPFTLTAEIIPRPSMRLMTVSAFVTDSEGEVIVKGIELTRQKKTDIFEGQIPAIAQTGTYSLTLSIEGIDPTGRSGTLPDTKSFVVGWPFWIRGILWLLLLLTSDLLLLKPSLGWLFFWDRGKRLVIGELQVEWPPDKKQLRWNFSSDYLAKELSIGIAEGDIALPPLSEDAPTGVFGIFKGNLENHRRQVAPFVVSTQKQQEVLVNGAPAPVEKKGLIWSIIRFIAPAPPKPEGISLSDGSVIQLGGYTLRYNLKEEV